MFCQNSALPAHFLLSHKKISSTWMLWLGLQEEISERNHLLFLLSYSILWVSSLGISVYSLTPFSTHYETTQSCWVASAYLWGRLCSSMGHFWRRNSLLQDTRKTFSNPPFIQSPNIIAKKRATKFPTLQHEGFNKNPNSIHSHHSIWKTK